MRTSTEVAASERRQHERTPVLLRVEYADASRLAVDYATDIGEGGIFLRTSVPHAMGETLNLVLSFPGLLEPTQVICVVRWVARTRGADGEMLQTGLGLQFVHAGGAAEKGRLKPLLSVLRAQRTQQLARVGGAFRVLFVEDNRFVRELFGHAVSRFSQSTDSAVHVTFAETALEALRLLEGSEPPHLIVCDHYMPGLSGNDLVRRLRAEPRFTQIPILMASVGGADVKFDAIEAGVTLFLDKPVLLAQLVDTMAALLANAEFAA